MLTPRRLRLLTFDPHDHPRGQPHLSSASGIVRVGQRAYVVADDEHHLAHFDARDPVASSIQLVRFLPGALPVQSAERKKHKPDVEVLLHVPAGGAGDNGLLVLLGSGSRPQRERAFAMELHPDGEAAGAALEVASAATFYAPLRDLFAEPNLEAGYAEGACVHLFQRANRGDSRNARITYDTGELRAWLGGRATHAPRPVAVHRFELETHDGVPFGVTDATAWSRPGCLFTAVAEDTTDAYQDGACVASMLGWMDADGQVRAGERLAGAPKVEGVTPAADGVLWLVTDADDADRASELLEVRWDP
jgi:hypothetical protein